MEPFPSRHLYLMNANGTGVHDVTPGQLDYAWRAPAPSGPSVAFAQYDAASGQRLAILNLNSGQIKPVTSPDPATQSDALADWSPSGNDIVFGRSEDVDSDIYFVHKDGSGLRDLTQHSDPSRDLACVLAGRNTDRLLRLHRSENRKASVAGSTP